MPVQGKLVLNLSSNIVKNYLNKKEKRERKRINYF